MVYILPSVSESLNNRIDKWYQKSVKTDFKYTDLLFKRYLENNPLLLSPVFNTANSKRFSLGLKKMLLTTLRKIEKQAKLDQVLFPRVTEETVSDYIIGIRFGPEQHPLKTLMDYAETNAPLYRSNIHYSHEFKGKQRSDMQWLLADTLRLLAKQAEREMV